MISPWTHFLPLTGRTVRLEPLAEHHAAGLLAAAEPALFQNLPMHPLAYTLAGVEAYIAQLMARPASQPFAIVLVESGQPVGITTYIDLHPAHRGLEIGNTWINAAHQGTTVNPESKYLLLGHAFEDMQAIRVQLKSDARNTHSHHAIEKLGAVREGCLRQHIIMPDGYIRDTIIFSITAYEWPAVKEKLIVRLGYKP